MHEVLEGAGPARRVGVERGIYRQANGKYVVCFMLDGKPRFRTVGYDLELARAQRSSFVRAARFGVVAAAPRLRLEMVADWWLERYKRRVASGERRVRTLEIHTYYLKRHVLPLIGSRLIREISVEDVVDLLDRLRERGCAEKTVAGALGTLNNVMRFAVRNSWIAESPVEKLERYERPRPERHPQRAVGREEIARLLDCCPPTYRTSSRRRSIPGCGSRSCSVWSAMTSISIAAAFTCALNSPTRTSAARRGGWHQKLARSRGRFR
jgi:integrase